MQIFRILTLFLFALTLWACGNQDATETFMPTEAQTCGGQIINGEYIVEWQTGALSVERHADKDSLREKFVRPNLGKIKRVEHNQKFFSQDLQLTGQSLSTASLDNWGYESIRVERMWQEGYRGTGVVVAVLDSGIDPTHPLLKNQLYVNAGEIADNNIDDDNNGYIDDVNGYNFVDKSGALRDDVGHGTHVSGIIAAEHNEKAATNSVALSVAPEAKILPVRFLGRDGGTLADALLAIDYVIQSPAKIINASWGGTGCSQILSDKIAALAAHDILFVVASGNSGSNIERYPEYPAAFMNLHQITVGSVSPLGGMSSFSNYSNKLVHIFAPGYEIFSTIPGGKLAANSGTSMATPFVAAAAALLKNKYSTANAVELKERLLSSVVKDATFQNASQGRLSF